MTTAPRMIFDSRAESLPRSAQHARRDADASGAEGGADEHVDQRVLLRQHPRRHSPAKEERRDDPEHRHQQARPAYREHVVDVRFQPDLEQQQDDSELGEDLQAHRGAQELQLAEAEQRQVADRHAEDQLAEHRRLPETLEELSAYFRRRQDDDQAEKDRHHRPSMSARVVRRGDPRRWMRENQEQAEEENTENFRAQHRESGPGQHS